MIGSIWGFPPAMSFGVQAPPFLVVNLAPVEWDLLQQGVRQAASWGSPGTTLGPVVTGPFPIRQLERREAGAWPWGSKGAITGLNDILITQVLLFGLRFPSHSWEAPTASRAAQSGSWLIGSVTGLTRLPAYPSPLGLCRLPIWGTGGLSLKSRWRSSHFLLKPSSLHGKSNLQAAARIAILNAFP